MYKGKFVFSHFLLLGLLDEKVFFAHVDLPKIDLNIFVRLPDYLHVTTHLETVQWTVQSINGFRRYKNRLETD
jgi:hypothetical protein